PADDVARPPPTSAVRFAGPCRATSGDERRPARRTARATDANKQRPVRWAVPRGRAAVGGARFGGRRDRGWWAGIAPAGPARGVRGPAGAIVWGSSWPRGREGWAGRRCPACPRRG